MHYVSDETGWWNLYRAGTPLYPMEAEFGKPLWMFGTTSYGFLDDGRVACVYTIKGTDYVGIIDSRTNKME